MKIIASTVCPVGSAAGHDADECRANLVEDGSIICIACATQYPRMSDRMKRIWRTVCSCGFRSPSVQLGSQTRPGTAAYDASCLCGHDPNLSDMVRAQFCAGDQTVSLQYERSNEAEIENPDLSLARTLSAAEEASLPTRIKDCVKALAAEGFCLRHVDTDSALPRVAMTCGRLVGSMGYVLGVSVDMSWRA